jgi:hypothetical protein
VIVATSWLIYTVIREYHQQVTQGFLIGVDKFKPPQCLMRHGFRVRRRSKVLIPGLGRCTAVKADNQGKQYARSKHMIVLEADAQPISILQARDVRKKYGQTK